jgi:DNA-directed RNA polymerase subunit RPC12/RpoP
METNKNGKLLFDCTDVLMCPTCGRLLKLVTHKDDLKGFVCNYCNITLIMKYNGYEKEQ